MTALKTLLAATLSVATVAGATLPATSASAAQTIIVVSQQACDTYATNYANAHVGPRARPVIGGTLIGAGVGFLVGGFGFGAPGAGALVGAGAGALVGAARGNPQWDATYSYAFQACMQGQLLY